MPDKKDKNPKENLEEIKTDNEKIEDKSDEVLDEELSGVAEMLQGEIERLEKESGSVTDWENLVEVKTDLPGGVELEKVTSEDDDDEDDETIDEEFDVYTEDDDDDDDDDEDDEERLCEHCEENFAEKDSRFCATCDSETLHTKINWLAPVLLLLVLATMVFGITTFKDTAEPFMNTMRAEKHAVQKNMYSSSEAYLALAQGEAKGYFIALRSAQTMNKTGNVGKIASILEEYFAMDVYSLNTPKMLPFKGILSGEKRISDTSAAFNAYITETFPALTTDANAVLSADDFAKFKEKAAEMKKETSKYSLGYIEYLLVQVASSNTDIPAKEQLEMISSKGLKDLPWLLIPTRATLFLELGEYDNAVTETEKLYKTNKEDIQAPVLLSQVYRRQEKFADARKIIDATIPLFDGSRKDGKGLKVPSAQAALLTQRSIVALLEGDFDAAVADSKLSTSLSTSLNDHVVLSIAYIAAKDEDGYKEVTTLIESSGFKVEPDVLAFKKGEKTLKDLFINRDGEF